MRPPPPAKRGSMRWILWLLVLVAAFFSYRVFFHPAFNPKRVAHAETEMWRAYYNHDQARLGYELALLFRNQYGLSLPTAVHIAKQYVQAAMKFQAAANNYDAIVLPDLTEAYRLLKQATRASYDPEAAARAELAWWVARRTPGQNSPEQVGKKIAELYAVLHGRSDPAFETSGLLRARAAALRDAGGQAPDWNQIEALLQQSYAALHQAF